MPTFTAIALDNLIEPGGTKTMAAGKYVPDQKPGRQSATSSANLERFNSLPSSNSDRGIGIPKPRVERRNGVSPSDVDKKRHFARISPALYATPETTPLPPVPDSPSSFPPSPYIINHKRRGPRLLKSLSVDNVATPEEAVEKEKTAEDAKDEEKEVVDMEKDADFTFNVPIPVEDNHVNNVSDGGPKSNEMRSGSATQNGPLKPVALNEQRESEADDFFDPQDSLSVKSSSSAGLEHSFSRTTPLAEFYDAWEELSPDSVPQFSSGDVETDLREIRSTLLMEMEKRKQAEEALSNIRSHWRRIREHLSTVGLTLPADPTGLVEDTNVGDPAEELCQQVYLARYVSSCIGKGIAKAEFEKEMEAQLEAKNFEITRLWDRLNYYEAVNREMSQRNQEVVENARTLRQSRRRKLRWIWGSLAAAVTIGTSAIVWSYLANGRGTPPPNQSDAPRGVQSSKS